MKLRALCYVSIPVLLAAVLVASPAEAGGRASARYVEPRIGGIYGRGVHGPGSYAVLIDVHEIRKDGGKRGKPAPAANCSNTGAESGAFTHTGWRVGDDQTAHLTASTVPSYLGSVASALQSSWDAWSSVDAGVPSVDIATDGTVTRYKANRAYNLLWGRTGG